MKFIDLFAGIGGFRSGMEMNGHECVAFCEIDKYARQSYKAIYDTEGEEEIHDITKWTDEHIREFKRRTGTIDCITGGFPCQSFSIAGKRGGFDDTRGTLFFEIMRIANIIRPRYLFLENVKGLLNHDGGATFETILNTLDEFGYDAEWQNLNSKNFGVPQNRERVFIIGHLRGAGGRAVFPVGGADTTIIKPHGQTQESREWVFPTIYTKAHRGDATYISEAGPPRVLDDQGRIKDNYKTSDIVPTLRAQSHGNEPKVVQPILTPDRIKKRQNGRRLKEGGEPMFTLTAQDRHGIAIREATKKGYKVAKEGDSVNLQYTGSETRRGRVGKGVANTLEASGINQGVVNKDLRIRKLTPLECWRLQGFTDEQFYKAKNDGVSDSQLYKQAGNSVTVNVIDAIARKL